MPAGPPSGFSDLGRISAGAVEGDRAEAVAGGDVVPVGEPVGQGLDLLLGLGDLPVAVGLLAVGLLLGGLLLGDPLGVVGGLLERVVGDDRVLLGLLGLGDERRVEGDGDHR